MKSIAVVTLALLTLPAVVSASHYGCTVLLCLAGNWDTIPECRGPVRRLFHDLSHGGPFPRCDMANGNDAGRHFARHGVEVLADCPTGMVATGSVQTDRGGLFRQCRSRSPVCTSQTTRQGPYYSCQYTSLIQRQFRAQPNWIDIYVDGTVHNRVWWR